MLDKIIHKYLGFPYILNIYRHRRSRNNRPTILLLHGIGSTGAAWNIVLDYIPKDVGLIVVDLLGFGESPKPKWPVYSAQHQARALRATLRRLAQKQPLIIVGHSMGALIAVEFAQYYPNLVDRLILCSPPFYDHSKKSLLDADEHYRRLYSAIQHKKQVVLPILSNLSRSPIISDSFDINEKNIDIYMSALNASIVNQHSLELAKKIPITQVIIHGRFDPIVITKNLKAIIKTNPKARLRNIMAGHEVIGKYVTAVKQEILEAIKESST
ncbi:alpha/beta fold hydrolase [Candidatus Saccharibacteria bacterium]|nr:alpha/beta fold hydrolase [Candidatus Saccharibacteria bacterium]